MGHVGNCSNTAVATLIVMATTTKKTCVENGGCLENVTVVRLTATFRRVARWG